MDKNIDIATETRTNWFERQFKIKASGSTIKTEIIAGITTFIAMSYILFVNPTILGDAGLDKGAVFVATALTGVVGCLATAFIANYPIAVAPGLGSNAFFAYPVVLGMGIPWQTALAGVFVASLLFMLVTVLKVREVVINAIPTNLKAAMAVGIGLFIAFTGLKQGGIVVGSAKSFVTITSWSDPHVLVDRLRFNRHRCFISPQSPWRLIHRFGGHSHHGSRDWSNRNASQHHRFNSKLSTHFRCLNYEHPQRLQCSNGRRNSRLFLQRLLRYNWNGNRTCSTSWFHQGQQDA